MERFGTADTVVLDDLPEGAVLEVVEVGTIPSMTGCKTRAFLCMDIQMRFVTFHEGSMFIGGPTSDALCQTLIKLGFKPVFFGPAQLRAS